MKKVELLSPAGSMDAFYAAIRNGANAIYLGGKLFGARANANNFTNEEIKEILEYAHKRNVLIYVTVNTIIYDEEFEELYKFLDYLSNVKVDGVIIQDLGVLNIINEKYPNLTIHASTQMNVHDFETAKFLASKNVKRIVLARECDYEVVKKIKNELDVEIEVFVHGALCVSYSGQCLMSSFLGNRSGNRGKCQHSCRALYQLKKDNEFISVPKHLLSTKDLFTLKDLDKLLSLGIECFKIEGRIKSAEYVALVTKTYRDGIDNYYNKIKSDYVKEIIDLKKIFNRDFTKGYMLGDDYEVINKETSNHQGVKCAEVLEVRRRSILLKLLDNISMGDGIRVENSKSAGLYINNIYLKSKLVKEASKDQIVEIFDLKANFKKGSIILKTRELQQKKEIEETYKIDNIKIPINGYFKAQKGSMLSLKITCENINFIIESNIYPESALKTPTTKERIKEQLSKFDKEPYYFDKLDFDLGENLNIPISAINEIRRNAVSTLNDKRLEKRTKKIYATQENKLVNYYQDKVMLKAKAQTNKQVEALKKLNIDEIYVTESISEFFPNYSVVLDRINTNTIYKNKLITNNLGFLNKTNDVMNDIYLNVVNSESVAFLNKNNIKTVSISTELNKNQIENLVKQYELKYKVKPNLEMLVYGHVDLMVTKDCVINQAYDKQSKNCDLCKKHQYYLNDERKNSFPIIGENNCILRILNSKKISLINNLNELIEMGIKNFRFDFTIENEEEVTEVINNAIKVIEEKISIKDNDTIKGHYYDDIL